MEAVLDAVKRNTKGKNEARRLRAAGKIPAVVYGAQKAGDAPAPESGLGRSEAVPAHPAFGLRLQHPDHAQGRGRRRRPRAGEERAARSDHASSAARGFLPRQHGPQDQGHRPDHAEGRSRAASRRTAACSTSCIARSKSKCCRPNIPDTIEVDVTDLGIGDSVHVRDLAGRRGVDAGHRSRS